VANFDERTPRVQVVLEAQGWTDMVEDHLLVVEEIVRRFYVKLHQRCDDSFWSWIRGRAIKVTPTLINTTTGAPIVCNLVYPWLVHHLPARADMVECFTEGHLTRWS
jgi:hypothetical protein